MSPDFPFPLDKRGCERCGELLIAAGMRFVEKRRESLEVEHTTIYGELVSPHGTFRCELHSSPGHCFFVVTIRGRRKIAPVIIGDLERAFAGHLRSRHEKVA